MIINKSKPRSFIENCFHLQTIFEIGNTSKNDAFKSVMSDKRQKHAETIDKFRLKLQAEEAAKSEFSTAVDTLEASSQVRSYAYSSTESRSRYLQPTLLNLYRLLSVELLCRERGRQKTNQRLTLPALAAWYSLCIRRYGLRDRIPRGILRW
jgi:hypothetical protein